MIKLLLLLLVFTSLAFNKEDERQSRFFSLEAPIKHQGNVHSLNQVFTINYFKGIDVTKGYSPHPGDTLSNDETGDSIT